MEQAGPPPAVHAHLLFLIHYGHCVALPCGFGSLEGSTEKWLQQVSGYYFAESQLQALRFASKSDAQASFLFYYDATEPFNAQDPTRNVNPEVVCCLFD